MACESYEAGVNAWLGQSMPDGSNGCVEAVVRIGSYYSDFLKGEYGAGTVNVGVLAEDAGDAVIPFDADKLECGDVIIYGDRDHVVTYDGEGGYVGNSSSRCKIVHGSDIYAMGLEPTEIIKTPAC